MPPPKRKVYPSGAQHRGRVTDPKGSAPPTAAPRPPAGPAHPSAGHSARSHAVERAMPESSSRYTPRKAVRFRPPWHRAIGFAILAIGVAIAVVNDVPMFGGPSILPFGHSEAYLLLAIVVAGFSTRLFGWFDRPT